MGTENCGVTNEPPGDELTPHVSKEDLAAHSSSPYFLSGWDENRQRKRAVFSGNPLYSKQNGVASRCPIASAAKGRGRSWTRKGNQSFAERHRAEDPDWGVTVTITAEHVARAGLHLLLGWPEYNIAFPWEGQMVF